MQSAERAPTLSQALALGLLQGPTELLPISSSAHTTLIPWLAGWSYGELDGEARKPFEIALHAGAGLALAIELRRELRQAASGLSGRRAASLALALLPPALTGLLLRETIERRLAGPRSIAAGLLAGAVAMAVADRQPVSPQRSGEDPSARDGLALGIAQALALAPGVSRNGATLTAARALGYERRDAQALSWRVGLPVILGASALEGARLLRGGRQGRMPPLVLGGAAAFASTRASVRLLGGHSTRGRRLSGYSIYRCVLGGLVVVRLRRAQ